ncbi:MAG: signal recognition particle protein [Bacilli bacterium]|nr:signal recognition particle protein [Bacilli bacterium]MDD3304961.1 signal recognition particle protein [Bacilli bacterium]MDD4054074.1 signal recognition particle protein [Bacilli bacterium]MDD4411406.1 signal recognition particle protein [Bacilli bacterium]
MFENLGERLQNAIKNINGYGKITEDNITDIMREVRMALLEADVNYQVVKEFTNTVKAKALGEEVRNSLSPSEMFVKILKDELIKLLGEEKVSLNLDKKTNVFMLVGLQGSGKTTTIGKLGNYLRKKYKKKSMFIACDVYRPAAIDQLKQLGRELDIFVYEEGKGTPVEIASRGVAYGIENHYDCVIIDTAGRLHIDDELMDELKAISEAVELDETILVIDSMMGQDAINVIEGFNNKLSLTGTILTKLDSDTRGGVALSVRHLTNIPIKLVGVSEKLDGIEEFDPSRMVGRILGEGDLLSLIEKAEGLIDEDKAREAAKKLNKGDFNLEDFLEQLKQIKKMGPLENLIKMIPGASKMGLNNVSIDPKQMSHIEAIILSMTPKERCNPEILKASRKIRIAKGSGTTVQEVNKLITQYEQMKKMMKMMKNGNMKLPF